MVLVRTGYYWVISL
ncbi:hypothetical protein LINGRAHAP2_LOCUS6864 [Linum grandiflorum]